MPTPNRDADAGIAREVLRAREPVFAGGAAAVCVGLATDFAWPNDAPASR